MKRHNAIRHGVAAACLLLLGSVVAGGGCSGGEDVGTCFFRCDHEAYGVSLFGCAPATKPSDDCAAVANGYCLTLGTVTGRHQFEPDCIVDCQSPTSCANCAPIWHEKMCVESDGGDGDASSEGGDASSEGGDSAASEDAQGSDAASTEDSASDAVSEPALDAAEPSDSSSD